METQGIALWRQVGEALVDEIDRGVLSPGEKLPASTDLAARFRVNRLTVLRAISHLQDEGLVRIERGRGTYVVENVLQYRVGARTRFEKNLMELNFAPARELIALVDLPATAHIAKNLDIVEGETVTLASLLGEADGISVSYGHNYFPTSRMPAIAETFRKLAAGPRKDFSITAVLAAIGISDFRRKIIRIRTRAATGDDARVLKVPVTESLLELDVVNVDRKKRPVMYAVTAFPGSRIEFVFEP